MTESPFQARRLLNISGNNHNEDQSNSSVRLLSRLQQRPNESLSESIFEEDSNEDRSKTDLLFGQFHEVLQSHGHDSETFDVVQELSTACRNVVEQLECEIERGVGGAHGAKQRESHIKWLKEEINTWRLLHALFYDRILLQAEDEMQLDGPTLGGSEKEVIQQLYAVNATLREYQLVVDWLEACYEQEEQAALRCHDRMQAWENTLFQLENLQGAAFGRGHDIVEQLDPDAPQREKKPLHALDEEDNVRLGRAIFAAIRNGRLDDALKLCKHFGQSWRAAILEGWRLHEDPNFDSSSSLTEKLPIEGNPRRDLWKKCAWLLADSKQHDEHTRATAAVFCGHLKALKSQLFSWQDLLWGYLKVQIDIRVESEIRGCCLKRYQAMPEDYWQGKMTLEQIFDELQVAKDANVRDYAASKLGVIQQHLILDSSAELLQHMCRWLDAKATSSSPQPQQLRFMAHIVLFLKQIGRVEAPQEQLAARIIAAYVEALILRKEPQLIAYYVASLPSKMQLRLYGKFLEQVEEPKAREAALEAALQAGLDIEQITRHTVETIRLEHTGNSAQKPRAGEISKADQRKIFALNWLTHIIEQRGELLWQANALMRHYLASSKIECVRQTFLMVPSDVVSHLMTTFGALDSLPPREECSLKEYLCYKVYLGGIDCFNEWTRLQQSQPQNPQQKVEQGNFTERVASEQKERNYRSDLARWETKIKEQAKVTIDALYNVLLFPEKGWLNDPFMAAEPENAALLNWEHRLLQLEKLRSICLPEVALLLHEVMLKSGDFQGCVRLADEIADERRQLYKVYTKHKLAELLAKIADASLQLLNGKLDPWGYQITA